MVQAAARIWPGRNMDGCNSLQDRDEKIEAHFQLQSRMKKRIQHSYLGSLVVSWKESTTELQAKNRVQKDLQVLLTPIIFYQLPKHV
jgi:hypothetical protein